MKNCISEKCQKKVKESANLFDTKKTFGFSFSLNMASVLMEFFHHANPMKLWGVYFFLHPYFDPCFWWAKFLCRLFFTNEHKSSKREGNINFSMERKYIYFLQKWRYLSWGFLHCKERYIIGCMFGLTILCYLPM